MKVTRDVVSDLWPLYVSGDASADTRSLVEEFLAGDPAFAASLEREPQLAVDVALPADHEARALERARAAVQGGGWVRSVRLVAVTLTVLAIVRFRADTPENVWPRIIVAAGAWALYAALSWRQRRRILRSTRSEGT